MKLATLLAALKLFPMEMRESNEKKEMTRGSSAGTRY